MAAQVFPCIISALWSAGDLFSSIYGVTSLKPKSGIYSTLLFSSLSV